MSAVQFVAGCPCFATAHVGAPISGSFRRFRSGATRAGGGDGARLRRLVRTGPQPSVRGYARGVSASKEMTYQTMTKGSIAPGFVSDTANSVGRLCNETVSHSKRILCGRSGRDAGASRPDWAWVPAARWCHVQQCRRYRSDRRSYDHLYRSRPDNGRLQRSVVGPDRQRHQSAEHLRSKFSGFTVGTSTSQQLDFNSFLDPNTAIWTGPDLWSITLTTEV